MLALTFTADTFGRALAEGLVPAMLFIWILIALAHCFLGYVIFRVLLHVQVILFGVFAGAVIVPLLFPEPAGIHYFLACLTCSAILTVAAWFLYRLMFALLVATVVCSFVALTFGSPETAATWVFAGAIGLGLGILTFLFLRPLFIFFTGLVGGFAAVAMATLIIADMPEPSILAHSLIQEHLWLGILLGLIALAVSVAGMAVQVKLARNVRIVRLRREDEPDDDESKRPSRSSKSADGVSPRAAKQ